MHYYLEACLHPDGFAHTHKYNKNEIFHYKCIIRDHTCNRSKFQI